MGLLRVGSKAPDIETTDASGEAFSLAQMLEEKAVVLFFYPKDGTPVCTREACAFRDAYSVFQEQGAEVIGISSNSPEDHKAFAATHQLPYRLLADTNGSLRKAYGAGSMLGLLPGRITYVIDQTQTIRMAFSSQMHAQKHVDEALQILRTL